MIIQIVITRNGLSKTINADKYTWEQWEKIFNTYPVDYKFNFIIEKE